MSIKASEISDLIKQRIDKFDSAAEPRNTGIRLVPGGLVLLPPGSVSTFVPNPDHIHQTGVPDDQPLTVSLHLYGRMLNSFHVYDRGAGTRRLINAAHTDS